MNYIETCTKIAVFLWRSSNYQPLTSVLHVRPGWIIYQNMRETWEKKVMKFEREIPIGLDARRKKWQGGAIKAPPPPMGLGLKGKFPKTIMWIEWVENNFTNPTVKVWADLDNPFKRSDYAKLCMSPSLDGTLPEYVISQEDNSPLTLYIDFQNFLIFLGYQ